MDSTSPAGKFNSLFRVGHYICEMSYSHGSGLHSEWSPDLPPKLSAAEWAQYRAGRNALVSEVARAIGARVMLVEA